jgi:hypothetical protein
MGKTWLIAPINRIQGPCKTHLVIFLASAVDSVQRGPQQLCLLSGPVTTWSIPRYAYAKQQMTVPVQRVFVQLVLLPATCKRPRVFPGLHSPILVLHMYSVFCSIASMFVFECGLYANKVRSARILHTSCSTSTIPFPLVPSACLQRHAPLKPQLAALSSL